MIVFPNCKINIGLRVLAKRIDGFHDLDTVFYPVLLRDGLEIIQQQMDRPTELTLSGIAINTGKEENICFKAWTLLRKDFPDLPSVRIHLHKLIPVGAGLGGGSANGAFTLVLLNRKFRLGLDRDQLMRYALQLGSDCPFFILNQPCLASGRGEILEPIALDLSSYSIMLVNPVIHIATPWAFSQIRPEAKGISVKDIILEPVDQWKELLRNDFEEPVFRHHPQIRAIKEEMYTRGAIYASLSGSGSTVFGLFEKNAKPALSLPAHYFIRQI